MHKYLKTTISLSLLLATSLIFAADINQQVLVCSQIESNAERLACFDDITKNLDTKSSLELVNSVTEKKALNRQKSETIETIVKEPDNKIANFGLPIERTSDEQQITAHLVGDIKRWDENSVFELDNGQIWRAVRSTAKRRRSPVLLSNPEVTITRAVLATYDLRIKGMYGKLKVKRIK